MSHAANPEMLFLARESRGLTQGEFAKMVGLSQATVSRYEGNLLEVADDHLDKIAEALNYPKDFFFQSESLYGFGSSCDSYHRKRQSLPARELRLIHAKINILRIQVSKLLRGAEVDTTNKFIRMEIDQFGSPQRIAGIVRANWRLPMGPIRSMVGAIENAGGIVFRWSFGTRKIDAVSQWPPGQPPLFFINADAPGDRVRYTLAHELGHIIMHETHSENIEQEADLFAAEFLMPERDIASDLGSMTLQKAAALKPFWKVSIASLVKRAYDLKRITDWQYKSLFIQLGKLGYRTNEPIPIQSEKISIIPQLLDVHFRDHKYSVTDLCQLLAIHEADFRHDYLPDSDNGLRVIG